MFTNLQIVPQLASKFNQKARNVLYDPTGNPLFLSILNGCVEKKNRKEILLIRPSSLSSSLFDPFLNYE